MRLGQKTTVSPADKKNVKTMLPYEFRGRSRLS